MYTKLDILYLYIQQCVLHIFVKTVHILSLS